MAPPAPESEAAPAPRYRMRFVLAGAANTLLTYLLYALLLGALGHRLSYTLAFASGIALAYLFNRNYVFRAHAGWRSVVAMPLVYLLQFGIGLGIVEWWVNGLGWPPLLAPLAAIAITLPGTYWLSKGAFVARGG